MNRVFVSFQSRFIAAVAKRRRNRPSYVDEERPLATFGTISASPGVRTDHLEGTGASPDARGPCKGAPEPALTVGQPRPDRGTAALLRCLVGRRVLARIG
jgi:hypothetical protein